MIFNLISVFILLTLVSFPLPTINSQNDWNTESNKIEEETGKETIGVGLIGNGYSNYLYRKENDDPTMRNFVLDLDANGQDEKIEIQSYPGFPGDQQTKIFINSNLEPALIEIGYFRNIQTYKINTHDFYVVKLQLQTGQSLNTLFYTYQKGKLFEIPVLTKKLQSWHGVISRDDPELKDIDNDGALELLAYYHFLYDSTRKVEVYKFDGKVFDKIQEYEETMPMVYF